VSCQGRLTALQGIQSKNTGLNVYSENVAKMLLPVVILL